MEVTVCFRPVRSTVLLLLFASVVPWNRARAEESEDPATDGQTFLMDNCMQCHHEDGPDTPDHNFGLFFSHRWGEADWAKTVDRMQQIAIEREYTSEGDWTDEDKKALVVFLVEQTRPRRSELQTLGQLHFAAVHFPIALVLVLGVLEFVGMVLRWPVRRDVIYVLWWFSLLATGVAVAFGFCLVWEMPSLSENLGDHRNAGLAAAAALGAGLILREIAVGGAAWARWASRLCLLLAVVSVGAAGHLGGKLIHGEYFQEVLDKWM